MRIAQIAPIPERVPPRKYGGTERVIYHLTEELVKMGHDVTLFASGDSLTSAKLVSVVDRPLREMDNVKDIYGFNTYSLMNMGQAYGMHEEFDIIHDHNAHMGLPVANVCPTPTVMTWHGPYDKEMTQYFEMLPNPYLVSISDSQRANVRHLNFLGTVYNGLPLDEYPFSDHPKDYLLYVGRIDEEKGVHRAIDAAVATGHKLIIAAKLDAQVPSIKRYFDRQVKPRLVKYQDLVQWIGEVDEAERNELMKNAKGFLHAITWPEPFGLTLIEAMACGCPVIAMGLGSIPEIIKNGETGFIVKDVAGMVDAIKKLPILKRTNCRDYARKTFSARRMAQGYEAMYREAIIRNHRRLNKNVTHSSAVQSPVTFRSGEENHSGIRSRERNLSVRP